MLMFLAFRIDQAQETCCEFFQRALKKSKNRIRLWEDMRNLFMHFFIWMSDIIKCVRLSYNIKKLIKGKRYGSSIVDKLPHMLIHQMPMVKLLYIKRLF
jgi:hypothetical protein